MKELEERRAQIKDESIQDAVESQEAPKIETAG